MIEMKGLHDIYQLHSAQGVSRAAKRPTEEMAVGLAESGTGRDVIQISPEASFRAKLDNAAKGYAQKTESGLSVQRLDALRAKYQEETCPVDSATTAQALLSRVYMPTTAGLNYASNPENQISSDL